MLRKTGFILVSISPLLLLGCSGAEAPVDDLENETSSADFARLCNEKGGTIEVAGEEFYCFLDFNGDGSLDSREYCTHSDFDDGECSLL